MQDLISIFNDSELELLVCGLPEIDTDDLRANTEYTGLQRVLARGPVLLGGELPPLACSPLSVLS